MASARKEALKQYLHGDFALTSVPHEMEDDFYRFLEAFAASRRDDEYVYVVEFKSSSRLRVHFANSGMHGGGSFDAEKRRGRWVILNKVYLVRGEGPNQPLDPTARALPSTLRACLFPAYAVTNL